MLQKLQAENFDRVYEILEEAFPADERRPYHEQKALLSNPKYTVYILPNAESTEIKAFIAIYRFRDLVYVEHFATNYKYRNQGLGSFILSELSKQFDCKICLEVELPETDAAKRRIEFYKRNGFWLNEFEYIQPPISKGKHPVPLMLMTSGGTVSEAKFESIKQTLYRNVYGII